MQLLNLPQSHSLVLELFMKNKRKHLRVTIPEDCMKSFNDAKLKAENEIRAKLSDSKYAAMLLKWALDQ